MWRNSQEYEVVVRVQKERIRSGRKGDKRFEGEGGADIKGIKAGIKKKV